MSTLETWTLKNYPDLSQRSSPRRERGAMSTSFPTSAESVDEWMQAINMARYTEQLKAAGITQARAPKKPIIQKSRRTLGSGGHERARARDAARVHAVCVCACASPLSHSRLSRLSNLHRCHSSAYSLTNSSSRWASACQGIGSG